MGRGGGGGVESRCAVFGSLPFSVRRTKECQTSMYIPFLVFKIGRRKKIGVVKNFSEKFAFFFKNSRSKKKFFFCFSKFFQEKWFFCHILIQYDLSFHLMFILDVFEERIRFSKIFIPNLGKLLTMKLPNFGSPYEKTKQARVLIIDSTYHWRPKLLFETMYASF